MARRHLDKTVKDSTERSFSVWMRFAFYGVALSAMAVMLLYSGVHQNIWGDGHLYFELSQHIFQNDFYSTNLWRQYEFTQSYGVTNPPLWPIVIAIFNKMFHVGLWGGFVVNCLLSIATLYILLRFGQVYFQLPLIGFVLYCVMTGNLAYWSEVACAGSTQLQLFMLSCMLFVYFRYKTFGLKQVIIFGLFAGLMMLNRSDFTLPAILLGLAIIKYSRLRKWQAGLVYYLSFGLLILPWCLHNIKIFGRPLVSDISRVALSAIPVTNLGFYIEKPPTLWERPVDWLYKLIDQAGEELLFAGKVFVSDPIFMGVLLIALILQWINVRSVSTTALPMTNSTSATISFNTKKTLWLTPVFLGLLFGIFLVSFHSERYYIPIKIYLILFLAGICRESFEKYNCKLSYITIGVAILAIIGSFYTIIHDSGGIKATWWALHEDRMLWQKIRFAEIEQCLGKDKSFAKVLVLDRQIADPIEFAALTGIRTIQDPDNLTVDTLLPLIKRFSATHVIVSAGQYKKELDNHFYVQKMCNLRVYKLLLPRASKAMPIL